MGVVPGLLPPCCIDARDRACRAKRYRSQNEANFDPTLARARLDAELSRSAPANSGAIAGWAPRSTSKTSASRAKIKTPRTQWQVRLSTGGLRLCTRSQRFDL